MYILSILLLLTVVAANSYGHHEKRSQPGVPQSDPVALRPLTWGDINIIQTTDTHGWLAGHLKEGSYSADFGDFSSFLHHMRQQANHRRKDLLVIDCGDIHDGSGLAEATALNGEVISLLFEKVNYDVLTIGNHELYDGRVAEDTYRNFAPKWGNRYVSSNVFFKDESTNKTINFGKLYNKFRMKFGTRVMTYGFLFNFTRNSNNTIVEPSSITVTLPWFKESLKEDVDMYLIAAHSPIRFPEARTVVEAIRAAHPSKPIILLGGHEHVRDFIQYDSRAVGMANGRYLETIGWLSVEGIHDHSCRTEADCASKNLTVTRRYLDSNVHTFKTHSLAHPKQKFDTWAGRKMTAEIAQYRKSLNLTTVLGCIPQDYYFDRYPHTDPRSLLNLLTTQVLPTVIEPSRANKGIVIINSGSQRFDLLKGTFTLDDAYSACPYYDQFLYITAPYKVARNIIDQLNTPLIKKRNNVPHHPETSPNAALTLGYVTQDDYGMDGDDWPHTPLPKATIPDYISTSFSTGLNDTDLVDVVYVTYVEKYIIPILQKLDPSNAYSSKIYRNDININSVYLPFVKDNWSNSKC